MPESSYPHFPQEIQMIQHLGGAECHTRQRIGGYGERQIGFLAEKLIQTSEQSAAAREHDPLVDDVRRQLRRRPLETRSHRVDDRNDGLPERFSYLLVGDNNSLGDAIDEIAALDLHREAVASRGVRRSQL